jgi:protein-tyrosine-phosphatase
MKFFKSKEPSSNCTYCLCRNAGRKSDGRSIFEKYSPDNYDAINAGTKPVSKINPVIVDTMKQIGIDN